ncbi:MAG: glutamate--tRNA ligase, partial [Minisyncoccia bacterium]
ITHIIRAQEHLSNTPRQILIREALGFPPFIYAHIPLVLAPDRTKLSKRNGATNTLDYRDMGYLPEALLNFLALIGWNPGTEQEIFTLPELIQAFSIERVQSGGGIFNTEKLDWVNREHIKKLSHDQQYVLVEQYLPLEATALPQYSADRFRKVLPIIIDRIAKFADVKTMWTEGELSYFFDIPVYTRDMLFFKKTKFIDENKYEHLSAVVAEVANMLEKADWSSVDAIKSAIWDYAESVGRGDVLWPVRMALSGAEKSPDPFTLAYVLGKDETLTRLQNAKTLLLN